jgi:hypothetical protein
MPAHKVWTLCVAFASLVFAQGGVAQPTKVFIVAGQSNAVGYAADGGDLSDGLSPQSDVLFWFEEGPPESINNPSLRITSGGWIPLDAQLDLGSGTFETTSGFGPEVMLGRLLADSRTDDIAIVKFAISRTRLAVEWNPVSGVMYSQLLLEVQDALAGLVGMGRTPEIAGFFWMQGETDARELPCATAYEANLENLIDSLRNDLGVADLPAVVARLHPAINFFGNYPYVMDVRMAQAAVAAADPEGKAIDTFDLSLSPDILHFDTQGELDLGARFAEAWVSITGPVPTELFGPDPGLPRADNTYTAIGCTQNRKVYFVFGFAAGSRNIGLCPGLTLDIQNPFNGGRIEASGVGVASLTVRIPNRVAGRTVVTQVIDTMQCSKSNLIEFTFPE